MHFKNVFIFLPLIGYILVQAEVFKGWKYSSDARIIAATLHEITLKQKNLNNY